MGSLLYIVYHPTRSHTVPVTGQPIQYSSTTLVSISIMWATDQRPNASLSLATHSSDVTKQSLTSPHLVHAETQPARRLCYRCRRLGGNSYQRDVLTSHLSPHAAGIVANQCLGTVIRVLRMWTSQHRSSTLSERRQYMHCTLQRLLCYKAALIVSSTTSIVPAYTGGE